MNDAPAATPHRTRIKICGLTRDVDVDAAVGAGADAVGFVLWPGSARHVAVERAAALARRLPPFVTPVALLVQTDAATIAALVQAIPHAVLQFHGDEPPEVCRHPGRAYLRAVRMRLGVDLLDCATRFSDAQALLLDTHVDGWGGSGKVFDWSLVPTALPVPVVLSGGLHASNVSAGIAAVRPWAVDVSSGVESAKGIKDAEAIRRFCAAVRRADADIAQAAAD